MVDLGPEIFHWIQPEPEDLVGLLFCLDRVQLRRMGQQTIAIGMALSGAIPQEVFLAMADSPEEGYREYQRYLAHQKLTQHASGTTGETI